jgi:trimeric autotransporter adhesin
MQVQQLQQQLSASEQENKRLAALVSEREALNQELQKRVEAQVVEIKTMRTSHEEKLLHVAQAAGVMQRSLSAKLTALETELKKRESLLKEQAEKLEAQRATSLLAEKEHEDSVEKLQKQVQQLTLDAARAVKATAPLPGAPATLLLAPSFSSRSRSVSEDHPGGVSSPSSAAATAAAVAAAAATQASLRGSVASADGSPAVAGSGTGAMSPSERIAARVRSNSSASLGTTLTASSAATTDSTSATTSRPVFGSDAGPLTSTPVKRSHSLPVDSETSDNDSNNNGTPAQPLGTPEMHRHSYANATATPLAAAIKGATTPGAPGSSGSTGESGTPLSSRSLDPSKEHRSQSLSQLDGTQFQLQTSLRSEMESSNPRRRLRSTRASLLVSSGGSADGAEGCVGGGASASAGVGGGGTGAGAGAGGHSSAAAVKISLDIAAALEAAEAFEAAEAAEAAAARAAEQRAADDLAASQAAAAPAPAVPYHPHHREHPQDLAAAAATAASLTLSGATQRKLGSAEVATVTGAVGAGAGAGTGAATMGGAPGTNRPLTVVTNSAFSQANNTSSGGGGGGNSSRMTVLSFGNTSEGGGDNEVADDGSSSNGAHRKLFGAQLLAGASINAAANSPLRSASPGLLNRMSSISNMRYFLILIYLFMYYLFRVSFVFLPWLLPRYWFQHKK